jgi:hypothetical protein
VRNGLNNPELIRNVWLELTRHRLIVTPLVLLLVFGTQIDESGLLASLNLMSSIAIVIFTFATILWSIGLAYNSLAEEVRQKTWDWQRVSAMNPWDMVWGKILGSTSFAWYIGLPCLAVVAFSSERRVIWFLHFDKVYTVTLLVITALAAQGFGLLSALVAYKNNLILKKANGFVFIFIILAWYLIGINPKFSDTVYWFGHIVAGRYFLLLSLVLFTFWIWLACYRLMQQALTIKCKPWAAALFAVFLSIYLAGKEAISTIEVTDKLLLFGFFISGLITYFGAWSEQASIITIKRIVLLIKQNQLPRALEETPYFVITLVLTLLCLMGLLSLYSPHYSTGISGKYIENINVKMELAVLFLLMLRDIGILIYCSLRAKTDRTRTTAIFYIALLDLLLPLVLPRQLVGFVFPFQMSGKAVEWGIVIALIHVSVVYLLIRRRLNTLSYKSVKT